LKKERRAKEKCGAKMGVKKGGESKSKDKRRVFPLSGSGVKGDSSILKAMKQENGETQTLLLTTLIRGTAAMASTLKRLTARLQETQDGSGTVFT